MCIAGYCVHFGFKDTATFLVWKSFSLQCNFGAIQVLRNADGGVRFSGKKRYEGVMINVISVTRGWAGPISRKITLRNTGSRVVERGSSAVECRTRNQGSPGSNSLCYRFEDWAFSFSPLTPRLTQLYK